MWISIDGCRGDYVDRVREQTPTFHRLMREGAYSQQLMTITPSITFPSHVSEATGVPVAQHGIPNNVFYDSVTRQTYKFPDDGTLLQAEPIWLTAKRQGVRTLVHDWPLSHAQSGAVRTDYFLPKFENELTDEQRLQGLIDTCRGDQSRGGEPLRLIMGYIKGTDPVGHKYGPDSPEIDQKMVEIDRLLGRFVQQATEVFRQKMSPRDRLYVLITTDHGMMRVKMLVNLRRLIGTPLPERVQVVTEGPVGMIYLDQLPEDERVAMKRRLLESFRQEFLSAWPRESLPKRWGFDHPTRVGDVVVMLKPGYTFSSRPGTGDATWPVDPRVGPMGMHGWPPEEVAEMRGICVVWRYPDAIGGKKLGRVNVLQLHPTVAKWLGVRAAHGATGKPFSI